jgi:hypothetical protein
MNQFQAIALIAAGTCCFATGAFGVDGTNRGNKTRSSARAPRSAPAPKQEKKTSSQTHSIDAHPGERALERLERMTPDERSKALANLPAQRRQEIEQKLEQFDRLPAQERTRIRNQLERMNRLPPEQQNQVRRSIRQFQALPDYRRVLLRRELDRMATMPDEARRAHMNTEEFRNHYSPREQQMIQDLSEILLEEATKPGKSGAREARR